MVGTIHSHAHEIFDYLISTKSNPKKRNKKNCHAINELTLLKYINNRNDVLVEGYVCVDNFLRRRTCKEIIKLIIKYINQTNKFVHYHMLRYQNNCKHIYLSYTNLKRRGRVLYYEQLSKNSTIFQIPMQTTCNKNGHKYLLIYCVNLCMFKEYIMHKIIFKEEFISKVVEEDLNYFDALIKLCHEIGIKTKRQKIAYKRIYILFTNKNLMKSEMKRNFTVKENQLCYIPV